MIYTRLLRRTILHFEQRFRTDDDTFMANFTPSIFYQPKCQLYLFYFFASRLF
jgi:hypothetical protein